jgi:hypothetical protein
MAKILMVLDGSYRYADGAGGTPDFTYTVLVGALEAAGHQVTKAHRGADTSAQFPNFNFETTLDLFDFDLLWLIGKDGRNEFNSGIDSGKGLGDPGDPVMVGQLGAIARFMQAGGGVFATGDHDSIGSIMCGHIPRVRAMRGWYGEGDGSSPMETDFPTFPRNYPRSSAARADTTQRSDLSDYDGDANLVYFENQSDSTPQTITAKPPVHPILRRGDAVVSVFPDHMHEGKVLADVGGQYDYTTSIAIGADSFVEFPLIAGNREMPRIIASGQTTPYTNKMVPNVTLDGNTEITGMKEVDTFSVYDGRQAGVGRIVTGSTFHHYVDINLNGDSAVDATDALKSGPDTRNNQGFAYAAPSVPGAFDNIKAVFANIADWLARPAPKITIVLERSTFSQDEANAQPQYDGVILVHVDGLKPSQIPGGPLDDLTPSPADLGSWAPQLSFAEPAGLSIVAIGVDSDDPALPERLQRFTFSYGLTINAASAFAFAETFNTIQLDAVLGALEVPAPLTDRAWIQLVKSANPYSLDLDGGNDTAWLSSDLKIFPVVAGGGQVIAGHSLAAGASRAVALDFLKDVVDDISIADFVGLPSGQQQSALSPIPQTTQNPKKNVYNFALARVRLSPDGADANDVRVFFRIVPSPTTAALTYHDSGTGPTGSYEKTAGGWAAPGRNNAHTDWVSFPVVAEARNPAYASQTDEKNEKDVGAGDSVIFGALIDNNLGDDYLTANPDGSGGMMSLPELMTGEHQCIVAQIEFPGAPIPDGATPYASDKLAQRNIAFSEIANPGLDASRMAFHTFEIEAAPGIVSEALPPDELLLDWRGPVPDGTEVRIYVSGWQAADVVALADRFYARHDIREVDAQTIALPGGGTRYVPLPPSQQRWTGVLIADFPIGVKRGQRFDLAVRQITNRRRLVEPPPPRVTKISREEAAALLQPRAAAGTAAATAPPRGAFDLGGNRTLVTDLRIFDDEGDHALVVEHPEAQAVAAAAAQSGSWRETVGAFQLGIPVSVKGAMLPYHLQLLSVMRWRAEQMKPNHRWHATFHRYVALLADKVRALGGDPFAVPATPDGNFPMPGDEHGDGGPGGDGGLGGDDAHGAATRHHWHAWHWLITLLLALILLVLLLLMMRMD